MNRINLIGVVVWSVELRYDRVTGRTIGKAMIAVSSDTRGLDFVPITLYEREAADAARYLGEGSRVAVKGHLHSELVTERDAHGARRTRRLLHVMVDRITYLVVRPPRGGERP